MSSKKLEIQLEKEKNELKLELNKLYHKYIDDVKDLMETYIQKGNKIYSNQINCVDTMHLNDTLSMNKTNDYVYTVSGFNKSCVNYMLYVHIFLYIYNFFSSSDM